MSWDRVRPFALFAAILFILGVPACAQQKVPPGVPTTLEAAVADIVSELSEKDKEVIRNTKYMDLILFHHTWGTGIRNGLWLWRGNTKLRRSACGKLCHPDDASMIIIQHVWKELKKQAALSGRPGER